MWKTVIAALAIALFTAPLAIAQDAKPAGEKETESKTKEEKSADQLKKEADKAEKLLKRAYIRVNSAEAQGLKKFRADADIVVDLSAMGMGEMPFPGALNWASGKPANWEAVEDEDAGPNPMAGVSDIAKSLFEPYMGYVVGFAAWDSNFKDATFALAEPEVDEDGKKVADVIVVTHIKPLAEDAAKGAKPETEEITYAVSKNKLVWLKQPKELQGQKAVLKLSFEYEDKGKSLRLSKVSGLTAVKMEGMPEDPKNPAKEAPTAEVKGSIEITKNGKVGEFEIATELKGSLSVMGRDFPTTLTITNALVNDDVKDEEKDDAEDGEPKGDKSDDDEF